MNQTAPQPSSDHPAHPGRPYTIGSRVRVTAHLVRGSASTPFIVEGDIIRMGQQKTGSWYAHARDKKLWLDRLELRKDDGELVTVNLDDHCTVEVIA